MENKMTEEQGGRMKALRKEIDELQEQVKKREYEIERIIVESAGDFEGSYVEYFTGDDYVFMKVEQQTTRYSGRHVYLQGPAITLPDTPLLEKENDDDGIDEGAYYEVDDIYFTPSVLRGSSVETIRKISKEDMLKVIDYYVDALKKNLV